MKNKLLISLALVAIVLLVCAFEMIAIDNISSASAEIINDMQIAHQNNDREKLIKDSDTLFNMWEDNIAMMYIFFQHESVDDIEQSLAIIKNSIEQEDDDTFQAESTRVSIQIQSLRDTEFPYIENIL